MPIAVTYNLLSTQVPVLATPADNPDPATTTSLPAILGKIIAGTHALQMAGFFNKNAIYQELAGRYGGGIWGVVAGIANELSLTEGAGLTLGVGTGVAALDVPIVLAAAVNVAMSDNGENYLWQRKSGGPAAVFNDLTPPAGACAYLGRVTTLAGAITAIDRAGVYFLGKGGIVTRRTGDTGAPADTPPASSRFVARTAGGRWLWDGAAWIPLNPPAAPNIVAAAEAANARQVTLRARDAQGNNLTGRRLFRLLIADAQWGGEAAAAPDGGITVDTGTLWQTITVGKHLAVLSDANGQVQFTITESAAKTFWVHAEESGIAAAFSLAFA